MTTIIDLRMSLLLSRVLAEEERNWVTLAADSWSAIQNAEHKGAAGSNSFLFTGRLRGRKLAPSRYNLVAKPAGAGAKAKHVEFRIVAR